MREIANDTGQAIKRYLKYKGIKQKWLADEINLSYVLLSNALNGRRKLTADELVRICTALKIELSDLIKC